MTKLIWYAVIAVIIYLIYLAYENNTGPLANLVPDKKAPEGIDAKPGNPRANMGFVSTSPSAIVARQSLPTGYRPYSTVPGNPVS